MENNKELKIIEEFETLLKSNKDDFKKCLFTMTTRRLLYLLSLTEAIIEFGPTEKDKERIDNLRKEMYEIEKIWTKEELKEIENKKYKGVEESLKEIQDSCSKDSLPEDLSINHDKYLYE